MTPFEKHKTQNTSIGITINNKLSWSKRIHNITSKANSVIGFLRRNFYQCPIQTKSALYLTLVRPILEYAVTVWAPHHQSDIHQLEAVQMRAARFVMNCYDRYTKASLTCCVDWAGQLW